MRGRLGALGDAVRGDGSRVGLATVVGSATVGLSLFMAVALVGPTVVETTPLSASWPLAFVLGASTAGIACAARATRHGLDRQGISLGAGAAAATFAVLSPPVAIGLRRVSPPVAATLLGGLVDPGRLFGLSIALAAPAACLGAALGWVLATQFAGTAVFRDV